MGIDDICGKCKTVNPALDKDGYCSICGYDCCLQWAKEFIDFVNG